MSIAPDQLPLTGWQPVPILMYHAVESAPRPAAYKHFYVCAQEFAWQMHALKRCGYNAVTFGDLAEALRGNRPLPPRPVLLTFDDGYLNLRENVHPLLQKLGFPYTVFLVSERIGRTNDWVAPEGYEPTLLLKWQDILAMQQDGGVAFEAHTATHPRLAQLAPADARREIFACKEDLEQRLGTAMRVLCYPYGSVSSAVQEIVREAGFAMAVTTRTGRVRARDNWLELPRISVSHVPPLSLTYGVGALNFWWRVLLWRDTRP